MVPCSVPMGLCRVVIMLHNANGMLCPSPYAVVDQFPHTPSMPPDANCIFCLLWPHDCLLSTSYICNLAAALRHRQFSLTLRVVVLRCKLPLLRTVTMILPLWLFAYFVSNCSDKSGIVRGRVCPSPGADMACYHVVPSNALEPK